VFKVCGGRLRAVVVLSEGGNVHRVCDDLLTLTENSDVA
jgi:hypothetical protein